MKKRNKKFSKKKNNKESFKNEKQEKVEEKYNYYTTSIGVHTNVDWKKVSK